MFTDFEDRYTALRRQVKVSAHVVHILKSKVIDDDKNTAGAANRSEVIANLQLAYRDLESASMRIGKAMQHFRGQANTEDAV